MDLEQDTMTTGDNTHHINMVVVMMEEIAIITMQIKLGTHIQRIKILVSLYLLFDIISKNVKN